MHVSVLLMHDSRITPVSLMQNVREILGVMFLPQIMSSESVLHYVGIPNLSSYKSSPRKLPCHGLLSLTCQGHTAHDVCTAL